MPETYDLHDGRFLQESYAASAANALDLATAIVPEGRVRTILTASYWPNVAETQTVFFAVVSKIGNVFPITFPISIALSGVLNFPALTEGLEIKLFPGEKLLVYRGAATAGSVMSLRTRFIETDLPYYSYVEPLVKTVKASQRHGSVYRSTGGISESSGPAPGDRSKEPGGRGEPQPI